MRSSWCGRSGASVAITMMIEPLSASPRFALVGSSSPTGTPAMRSEERVP
jgi:hypothetical protein